MADNARIHSYTSSALIHTSDLPFTTPAKFVSVRLNRHEEAFAAVRDGLLSRRMRRRRHEGRQTVPRERRSVTAEEGEFQKGAEKA